MSPLALLGGTPVRSLPWPRYPFYGPEVEAAVTRVARSEVLCSAFGTEVEAFERAFALWHSTAHAVCASSGTTALQLALAAAGVGAGDEVIVPAYTFIATASAAIAQNAIPVLVDSEPVTLGLDPADVRRKLSPRTKAIMPVHVNGHPCDMDAIMEIAAAAKLTVIEDCSHAHGAMHRGRKVGTIGHLGVFSFQHQKNLSVGEGGGILTADAALADTLRKLRSMGWLPMKHNYRMTEFHGAVGQVQLARLDAMNAVRRANAALLARELDGVPGIAFLPGRGDCVGAYYNCIFRYDAATVGIPRARFIEALRAEGIPMRVYYYPLQRDSIFEARNAFGLGCPFSCPLYQGKASYDAKDHPVATDACDRTNLEFKVHPPCGEAEMREAAAAVRKIVAHAAELRQEAA